jgi:WS/DGAT/MGAT family acyltransferase
VWVDDPAFELGAHVRAARVPEPGDEAALLATVAQLRRSRLEPVRPMWEMWLLEGLPDQRVALFVRLHHVLADGVAGVATIGAFLDPDPHVPASPVAPWGPEPPPDGRALLHDNARRRVEAAGAGLRRLRRPGALARRAGGRWRALRELLVDDRTDPTSLNRLIGPDRTLALLHGDLAAARSTGHAHGGTVNDVLLTATAGGLRALLAARGEQVDAVRAFVPVSLRHGVQVDPAEANLISQMVVPLPVGEADPGRRLELIAAETAARKAVARPSLGAMFHNPLVAAAFLQLLRRNPVNVETADVPGPPVPVYLAGARVLDVAPLVNLLGNVTLGVGALSYAGRLGIMAVADADAVPDLPVFARAAQADLDALAQLSPARA